MSQANRLTWSLDATDTVDASLLSLSTSIATKSHGMVTMNRAYTVRDAGEALVTIAYNPSSDAEPNTLFQFGWVLPEAWVRTFANGDPAYRCVLDVDADPMPDCCVYQLGLYACLSGGAWEVVQTTDDVSLGVRGARHTSHVVMPGDAAAERRV